MRYGNDHSDICFVFKHMHNFSRVQASNGLQQTQSSLSAVYTCCVACLLVKPACDAWIEEMDVVTHVLRNVNLFSTNKTAKRPNVRTYVAIAISPTQKRKTLTETKRHSQAQTAARPHSRDNYGSARHKTVSYSNLPKIRVLLKRFYHQHQL
jgi:hypothetical protein